MKTRLIVFLIFTLGISFGVFATTGNQESIDQAQSMPYQSGENLEFSVSFGFYTGARAYMSVSDSLVNGIQTHHVRAFARSVGMADYLFKIRDRYETFINPQTNLPVLSIRDIREGRYKNYNEITYNRDSSQAISMRTGIHKVPSNIQDILSVFFFGRKYDFNDNLQVNQLIIYRPFFCDEVFPLILRFRGIETIKTNVGKLECYKFSMCEEKDGQINTLDDMSFWLTRDANRIPVKIEFKIVVGSFVVEIEKCSGLKTPLLLR